MTDVHITEFGGVTVDPRLSLSAGQVFRMVQTTKYNSVIACLNVFYFATDTSGNSASSLVADWAANIVPTWKNQVTNAISFIDVTAQELYPTSGPMLTAALSGTGAIVSLPVPVVCAGVLTWRTSYLGRSRRGRSFIAGLEYAAPATSNGYQWISTGITRLNNLGNAILTRYQLGGNPVGFYLIVWSRKLYTANPTAWPSAAAMVTRFSSQPYIATMGTRRYGRGM